MPTNDEEPLDPLISLPATIEWEDTGISVTAGDLITISATGTVYISEVSVDQPSESDYQTPGGDPDTTTAAQTNATGPFAAPGLVPWSLVGEIGTSGTPFEIGNDATIIAATSGELYLSVNAVDFSDNSGAWNVSILDTPVSSTSLLQSPVTSGTIGVWTGAYSSPTENSYWSATQGPLMVSGDLWNTSTDSVGQVMLSVDGTTGSITADVDFSDASVLDPSSGTILGYPNVLYGQSPWGGANTSIAALELPAQVSTLEQQPALELYADYSIQNPNAVQLDFVYDMFLTTDEATASSGGPATLAPSIELMIWLDEQNGISPAGTQVANFSLPTWINGQLQTPTWNVYVGNGGSGTPIVTFELANPPNPDSSASVGVYLGDVLTDLDSSSTVLSATGAGWTESGVLASYINAVQLGSEFFSTSSSESYSWTLNAFDILSAPLCFLAGTLIATPSGEVPVEQLASGDAVLTADGDVRPIVWVGVGRVLAARGRRNAATPVIVRKGALADNVPHRDLRVTKSHALYANGVLIPVEFLVNHRSIIWDDHAQEVKLYHIELSSHAVLLANGAPAESYRDDGNRWLFQNANSGWGLPPQAPCAPVLTGGAIVDTTWRQLLERDGPRSGLPLTEDPDLHLLVDGRRVDATHTHGLTHVFGLPSVPKSVRIVSRASVPAELGLARDPRCLGVALRQLVQRRGPLLRVIDATDAKLQEGFHVYEDDNRYRWTDGNAALPPTLLTGFAGPFELDLHIGDTARYVDDGSVRRAA